VTVAVAVAVAVADPRRELANVTLETFRATSPVARPARPESGRDAPPTREFGDGDGDVNGNGNGHLY